jgi:hypothetical protein
MSDQIDVVLSSSADDKMQSKEDIFFAMQCARDILYKFFTPVTPSMGLHLISTHMLNPFHNSGLFRKWDKGMNILAVESTSYSMEFQEA